LLVAGNHCKYREKAMMYLTILHMDVRGGDIVEN
jgi:hypothetical protein